MKLRSIRETSTVCSLQSVVCPLRAGFTLLELMTVMVIMFILMGMSTMALRGVVRGAGISGAVSNAKAVLTQARQHAIMNQRQTAVVLTTNNTMTIVTRYGKAAGINATELQTQTEFPWSDQEMRSVVVYNMRTGGFGKITADANTNVYSYIYFRLMPGMPSGSGWTDGDGIGLVIGEARSLPSGIEFGTLPDPPVVTFNADGSAVASADIELKEKKVKAAKVITLSVKQTTGWVEVH